jgi:hypothetical protein
MAQTAPALQLLLTPVEPPMLTYATVGRINAVTPADVFEIEISESGGITDVFVRLAPSAGSDLAEWTTLATGFPMSVRLCGTLVIDAVIDTPNTTGTFYIPNLNALQAEALRAVWQGRETCSTLPPEVFPIGQ